MPPLQYEYTLHDCCDLGKRCYLLALGIAPCQTPAENPFRYTRNPFHKTVADVPRSLKYQGSWDLRTDPTRAGASAIRSAKSAHGLEIVTDTAVSCASGLPGGVPSSPLGEA